MEQSLRIIEDENITEKKDKSEPAKTLSDSEDSESEDEDDNASKHGIVEEISEEIDEEKEREIAALIASSDSDEEL